ncbi:MAG: FtsH protease activity modulator HflK [Candidatus Brocadiia bacterium]
MSWQRDIVDLKREFKQYSQDFMAILKLALVVAILGVIAWFLLSSFYTVDAREQAVILRFGKESGIREPGLHWKLPFGIDKAKKVAVREKKRQEFGLRTKEAGVRTVYMQETEEILEEGRMLTGDLNILVVPWIVRYRVSDIRNYLFNVCNPEITLRDVSEAVMRTIVGNSSVDEVLTTDRERVQAEAQVQIQDKLNDYEIGIDILSVRLKDVTPPELVKDAFNQVNQARQRKKTIENEAIAERNSKIPEASGKKERMIEEARGYKARRVNEAEGNVARFTKLLKVHSVAPDITEQRLYFEAMQEVFPKARQKYVIDSKSGDLLKFLDLHGEGEQKGARR